jgi:hypothetical protein
MSSTREQVVALEPAQERCPTLGHLWGIRAEGTRLSGLPCRGTPWRAPTGILNGFTAPSFRGSEVKQGGQIGVETQKLQGSAHKLAQSSHGCEPLLSSSSRRGQRRQERPKRIHGAAFFLDGQEGNGWRRARQLEKKFVYGFRPTGQRHPQENAAREQTVKEELE